MENLSTFITVVFPASLCMMAFIFGLLAMIGPHVIQARWDREDAICDGLDEFYYDVRHCKNSVSNDECYLDSSEIVSVIISDRYLKELVKFSKYTTVSFNNFDLENRDVYN